MGSGEIFRIGVGTRSNRNGFESRMQLAEGAIDVRVGSAGLDVRRAAKGTGDPFSIRIEGPHREVLGAAPVGSPEPEGPE